jgi:hypothetical protein
MPEESPITSNDFKLPITDPGSHKKLYIIISVLCLVVLGLSGIVVYMVLKEHASHAEVSKSPSPSKSVAAVKILELDLHKNYGNKYADGVLPVGDGKYVETSPKKGYLFTCGQYAQNIKSDGGGADQRGPWFTNNNTSYDLNKKIHVKGNVTWQGNFSNTIAGGMRTIATNDLPLAHATGTFPIAGSDPARAYDKNPNSIKAQTLSYVLPASPDYGGPQCMSGEVGVMLTGVALFNAFDAGGRDAGAWEVQDDCSGHPQVSGEYHYHTLSSCIHDISVHTVIGFALDGFPITGPEVGDKNILTTNDLDECHGIKSEITLDGKTVNMYHYVMTQDFPYSVSCFRSTAIQPPGQQGSPPQA